MIEKDHKASDKITTTLSQEHENLLKEQEKSKATSGVIKKPEIKSVDKPLNCLESGGIDSLVLDLGLSTHPLSSA